MKKVKKIEFRVKLFWNESGTLENAEVWYCLYEGHEEMMRFKNYKDYNDFYKRVEFGNKELAEIIEIKEYRGFGGKYYIEENVSIF